MQSTLTTAIVIKELEEEDRLWQANARRRQKKEKSSVSEGQEKREDLDREALPAQQETKHVPSRDGENLPSSTRKVPRGFY